MKSKFKISLIALAILIFTLPSLYVNAADEPSIEMSVGGPFYIGESQEFTISTIVPEGYRDVMVIGTGGIEDESVLDVFEYYNPTPEVQGWYNLKGEVLGPPEGFKLVNGTSKFRATFNKAGKFNVIYKVQEVSTKKTIAENSIVIEVKDRSVSDVSDESQLLAALKDNKVKTINITADFATTDKVNITRDLAINGNMHKITLNMADKTKWDGKYVLQAYKSKVSISDITLTGGNAGLLVNGANVTLKGKIDVSNNGFGGIELANAAGIPAITFDNVTITNSSEEYLKPTLWTDPKMDSVSVNYAGFEKNIEVKKDNGNLQTQYYLSMYNTIDTADNQIKDAIKNNADTKSIEIDAKPDDSISAEVLNQLKSGPERDVIIHTGAITLSFNTKNMVDNFDKDLNLNITVSKEQTFENEDIKKLNSDVLFVYIDYEGNLPKDTKITFNTQGKYKTGDKVFLYYYNPETNKNELISENVEIGENGIATISIDHASTYFLSSQKVDNSGAKNPNTSDMTMYIIAILVVLAILGFAYAARVKFAKK